MCTVSMVSDHYLEKWKYKPDGGWTNPDPGFIPPNPNPWAPPPAYIPNWNPPVTKQEFEELKKEVLEMKQLLKRALKYDEDNNEPHCELDDKIKALKLIADAVGVSLEDLFPKETK